MQLLDYAPLEHYAAVRELWERTLGPTYPVSERVLYSRIVTRSTLEPGDGIVAVNAGRVVAFGMVEIDRAPLSPPPSASIHVLLVDPAFQRQGMGTALLQRLEQRLAACGFREWTISTGLFRFWSGVSEDLPAALAFFRRHGYQHLHDVIDMYTPLSGYRMENRCRKRMEDQGVSWGPLTDPDFAGLCEFMKREAAGWRPSMLTMLHYGDMANMIVFKHEAEFVGCIQCFTPASRFRGVNVSWERIYGENMGGFGAVLIAQTWRGRGLGTCLCQAAAEHISTHGGTGCFIDWTNHERAILYRKIGAEICKTSGMFKKTAG